jgi:hypothetical protein
MRLRKLFLQANKAAEPVEGATGVPTKEMILENQKEQQNKPAYEDAVTGDKFQYVPSNVNEPLNPYNIVNLPSGSPASEGDINLKTYELMN